MPEVSDVVRLLNQSVSMRAGKETILKESLIGRVCSKTATGFCWVQFKGVGCRMVHESRLEKANSPSAPDCASDCT
jgi:hypothetical protein